MTQLSKKSLDRAFAVLERIAVAGERCPKTSGPNASDEITSGQVCQLAYAGRIKIEISGQNFRKVTILVGEHQGKTTLSDPSGAYVYKIVDSQGSLTNGQLYKPASASREAAKPQTKLVRAAGMR